MYWIKRRFVKEWLVVGYQPDTGLPRFYARNLGWVEPRMTTSLSLHLRTRVDAEETETWLKEVHGDFAPQIMTLDEYKEVTSAWDTARRLGFFR